MQLATTNTTKGNFCQSYPRPQTSWLKSLSHTLSMVVKNHFSRFQLLISVFLPKGIRCTKKAMTLLQRMDMLFLTQHCFLFSSFQITLQFPRVPCLCLFFLSGTSAVQVFGAHWICNSPHIKGLCTLLCVKYELWLGELVMHAVKLYWLALITNQP